MKQSIANHVFWLTFCALAIAAAVMIAVVWVYPGYTLDREFLSEQELVKHNETLEHIKQDITSIFDMDNVKATFENGEIKITIVGTYCDQKATLNSKMEIVELSKVDRTEEQLVGLMFGSIGLGLVFVIAGYFLFRNFLNMKDALRNNRMLKIEAKTQERKIDVIV